MKHLVFVLAIALSILFNNAVYGQSSYVVQKTSNGTFSGSVYAGSGHCTYDFDNGDWYEGEWKNDMIHGKGVVYHQDGKKEKVVYKDGKRIK